MLLHHLEGNLDISLLPVNTNNLFVCQINFGGDYGQPVSFVAMANKNDFHFLLVLGFLNNARQDVCFAWPFSDLAVKCPQGYPMIVVPIKNLRHVFRHTDDGQMSAKLGKNCRPTKSIVHKNGLGFNAKSQSSFYHSLKMLGGLGYCLQSSFISADPLGQSLFDTLSPLLW